MPVLNVSDVTGFPEMMDGRVKTLHPKIHGGILARRHRPDDLEAIASQGIELVDLVVVNLYPFVKAASNPETPFDELVEQIDIGGPSLLRAAGKNFRDVLVVVDPADYPKVLEQLARPGGPSLEFRFSLMRKAFAHTAEFDSLIAQTMETIGCTGTDFVRQGGGDLDRFGHWRWPASRCGTARIRIRRPNGDHFPPGMGDWQVHQGKELSYTNLLDLDAALRIALEFTEPAAVVIKHTNPCGVATGATIAEAYVAAREADPLSAFGGIVGLNHAIDAGTAAAITSTFIEAVIAPSVEEDARAILSKKANLRVLTADFDCVRRGRLAGDAVDPGRHPDAGCRSRLGSPRSVASAFAPCRMAPHRLRRDKVRCVRRMAPHRARRQRTRAVTVDTGRDEAAADGGGMDRAAICVARLRAREVQHDRVHRRGPDARRRRRADEPRGRRQGGGDEGRAGDPSRAASSRRTRSSRSATASTRSPAAGATAVVQPGGSVKDAEVIAAADEHGLAMVFTGRRHFRH